MQRWLMMLSVSSNGSCAVKGYDVGQYADHHLTFSILERIVCGEGHHQVVNVYAGERLSVSSNGSCAVKDFTQGASRKIYRAFSILERIVCGEGDQGGAKRRAYQAFQYPRTDRVR